MLARVRRNGDLLTEVNIMSATLAHEKFDPLSLYDTEIGTEFKILSPFQQRLEREEAEIRRAKSNVENWRAISSTRERLPKVDPNSERFAAARRHARRAAVLHTSLMAVVYVLLLCSAGLAMAILLHLI